MRNTLSDVSEEKTSLRDFSFTYHDYPPTKSLLEEADDCEEIGIENEKNDVAAASLRNNDVK
ncbi:hypothetical protein MTR_3g080150 [Medicago truncatula]|uniref:Uncharacterized protein n=1 Tax=Medicago truncatula TaxID=3880 RepID=G7J6Q5_MEDTR|nr:hypothetical protein MTR_3g080150 [Medicago truncatula]